MLRAESVSCQQSHANVQRYRLAFLKEVGDLLSAGADPNMSICVYDWNGRSIHKILGANNNAAFIEGHHGTFLDAGSMLAESTGLPIGTVFTPFVESVLRGDADMIVLLSRHGVKMRHLTAQFSLQPGTSMRNTEDLRYSVSLRCQLMRELILHTDVVSDYTARERMVCHFAGTLSLISTLSMSYGGHGILTESHQDRIKRKYSHSAAVSYQAIRLVTEKPTMLPALVDVTPISHIAVLINDWNLLSVALQIDQEALHETDEHCLSALHTAVGNTGSKACEHLVQLGADVNALYMIRITPLLDAVYFGNLGAARILLNGRAGSKPAAGIATQRPSLIKCYKQPG